MKKFLLSFFGGLLFFCIVHQAGAQRNIISINDSWKFGTTSDQNVITSGYNDSGWSTVNLPHTWNGLDGQDGGNNLFRGAKWYRKFILAENNWQGKKVFLRFGAANMKTDVYVNGQSVGTHIGGYAAFIFDITNFLTYGGNNIVAVKVDNSSNIDAAPLSGDFSFFGGITRKVELIVTEPVFISPLDFASPGIYITPYNISATQADVKIQVLVGNHSAESKNVEVIATIKDRTGAVQVTVSSTISVNSNTVETALLNTEVANPVFWNGTINPYLYKVEVSLKADNKVTDRLDQPLGFRTFSVNDDTGFSLNNHSYSLHGVCLHEDRPDIGRAISDAQRKEDLDILQDLGCTYLRLVHCQHGEFTYDYCDTLGVVLSTEVPLVNLISSSVAFGDNAKTQLKELIKQNYNHPSVMFWGMYNEVNFHAGPAPAPLIAQLNTLAHQLDSTRLTTGAAQKDEADSHWLLDVCGWNKYMGWYDGSFTDYASWADWLRGRHPDTKIGMSEYGAGASINQHQETSVRPNPGGMFHPEEYQCDYHEAYYQAMLQRPFIWSSAVWVAFDFASDYRAEGDALGINDKGLITRNRRVKKDAFYYYKANWTDDPFVYITSRRFVERTNAETQVKVYSNCDSVELKVNDKVYSFQKSNNHIFKWHKVTLTDGDNKISVKGFKNNEVFSDGCTWKYKKSTTEVLLPGDLQINFQTPTSKTPTSYLADVGYVFGNRGNGYSYGWNVANTANTRERSFATNPVFNTLNHILKDGVSYIWEIAVENGTYQVSIGCGDPDYTDSYHKILIEDKLVLEGINSLTQMKVSTDTVIIKDGRLSVKPASGASNAKINCIHINRLDDLNTSIHELFKNDELKIHINQNKSIILQTEGGSGINAVSVCNLNGQTVFKHDYTIHVKNIETPILSAGLYLVKVSYSNNSKETIKVIVV